MDVLTVFFLLLCVGHCHGQRKKTKLTRLRRDVDYLSDVAEQLKLDIDGLQAWRNATLANSRERDVIDSNTDSRFLRSFQQAFDIMEGRVKYILHGLEGEKMTLREVIEDIRQIDTSIGDISNRLDLTTQAIGDISEQVSHLSKQPSTNVQDNTGTNVQDNTGTNVQDNTGTNVQDNYCISEPRTKEYYTRMKQDGWVRYNNNLYKLFGSENFPTAVERCKAIGASLVEITDMAELQFIRENIVTYFSWFGASNRGTEGEWRWLSGQLVKDDNWRPGHPGDGREYCLGTGILYGFKYKDYFCADKNDYICKIQDNTGTNVQDNTCISEPRTKEYFTRMKQDGWLRYNNNLYKLFGDKKFPAAVERCKAIGASLVEITDMAELQFLSENIDSSYLWVGASDRGTEGEWRWLSGQLVKDDNWSPGRPNDDTGLKDCLLTGRAAGFKYRDYFCSDANPYICKLQ